MEDSSKHRGSDINPAECAIKPIGDSAHPAEDSAKGIVRIILNLLAEHGVKDIVCSPGSRNAPLLAAAEARPHFRKHIVIDERSAAFVALGMAQVGRAPVALICTSGTALLNYAPAVAEAFYQAIPLIVVSADRPLEWIDQDDSQTINQFEALRNIVKKSYDLTDSDPREDYLWYANRTVNDAMLLALRQRRGPVHINVRLSAPLGVTLKAAIDPDSGLNSRPEDYLRVISEIHSSDLPEKGVIRELARRLRGKKVMIVAGFMPPDAVTQKGVAKFRRHPNVAVFAETISNLHLPAEDYMTDSILCALDERQLEELAPDVVISIGGALVSRMLKAYLRRCAKAKPSIEHWSIGYQHTTVDCFQALTMRIEANPGKFINLLSSELAHLNNTSSITPGKEAGIETASTLGQAGSYAARWSELRTSRFAYLQEFTGRAPWSDLKAFSLILNSIPADWNLSLSNGTAIRYAQILSRRIPHASFCNRGVSGIEGSTSTALGESIAFRGKTLLLSGDMSLAYDLGGISAAARLDSDLKIIVVNNRGGGIFRFVKSTASLACREEYLCADPHMNFRDLAATFGYAYLEARNEQELKSAIRKLFEHKGRCILEVLTPPEESTRILNEVLNQ